MFVDDTVTVPPSSMTATTSGMTSYLSGQYAVGVPAFTIQPTPPIPAATVPMQSCATGTPCPPTQNFVAFGADAVQGPTFPVPVAVAGTSSTTVAACGSASTDVKSTVDGASLPTSTAGVAGQLSTTSTSSGSGSGPARPARRRRRLSVTGPAPVHRCRAPPCRHRRLHLRRLPVYPSSSCVSSRQCVRTRVKLHGSSSVTISAVSLRSTHGRHLKKIYNT